MTNSAEQSGMWSFTSRSMIEVWSELCLVYCKEEVGVCMCMTCSQVNLCWAVCSFACKIKKRATALLWHSVVICGSCVRFCPTYMCNALLFALPVQDFLSQRKRHQQQVWCRIQTRRLQHVHTLAQTETSVTIQASTLLDWRGAVLISSPLCVTMGNHCDHCNLVSRHRHFLFFSFPVTGG